MTREEAIKVLKRMKYPYNCKAGKLIISNVDRENEALDMAISALERDMPKQPDTCPLYNGTCAYPIEFCSECPRHVLSSPKKEPCNDTVSIRKDAIKTRVGNIVAYNVEWLKKHWQMEMDIVCGVKPCDDAISREAALKECHDIVVDGERYRVIQEETLLGLPPIKPQTEIIRCSQCKYAEVADSEDSQDGYTCQFHRGSIWFSGSYCSWAERRQNG